MNTSPQRINKVSICIQTFGQNTWTPISISCAKGQCILVDGKVLSGVTSIADPNFYVHFEKIYEVQQQDFSPKTSTAKYNTDLGQQLAFTSLAFKHHGDMGALLAEYQSIFRGWNGRFNNWRGYFVEVDVDGGWVFDGDISVKTAFGKDHRVGFQHPYSDLNEATLKLNGVRDMEPEDQMLVDLLQQPLSSKDCANISGKLLQPIQNIAGSSPLFYVNLTQSVVVTPNRRMFLHRTNLSVI